MQNVVNLRPTIWFIMKLSLIIAAFQITFIGMLIASDVKAQNLDNLKIEISLNNSTVEEGLIALSRKSGIRISYSDEMLQKERKKITLNDTDITAGDALRKILDRTNLKYRLFKNYIIIDAKPAPVKPGRVSGKILDNKGEVLPGASIKVLETGTGVRSGVDGSYSQNLPPGTYTLEISYLSFLTQRITGIVVNDDKNTPLDIVMKPDAKGLKEVMVTSSYKKASIEGLYARQKNSSAMSDGITAEQISRTPDNNTAQVLRRVSGLQVSQNKYVVVRGLSDRYNNVLLNGNQLPSTEPNRRDFAFDMIPSGLVDNIVVNKTATPDLPGEFTGGLVQVTTKDIPDENFVTLSIGTGYNNQATGKDFFGGRRGAENFFGFANDYQKKPQGVSFGEYNILADKMNSGIATDADKNKVMQVLSKFPDNWAIRKYTAKPIQNYALSIGRSIPFENSRLGVVAAVTYRNEQTVEQNDQFQPTEYDYSGTDYVFTTLLGGSLNLGYSKGKNKFTLKNTYNRRFSDKMYRYGGRNIISNSMANNYSGQTLIMSYFKLALRENMLLGAGPLK